MNGFCKVFGASSTLLAASATAQFVEVQPISDELGLADVVVRDVPDEVVAVYTRFRWHPTGEWFESPLIESEAADGQRVFRGRFMAGEGEPHQTGVLRYRVLFRNADGRVALLQPEEASTDVNLAADEGADDARSVAAWALGATWYQIFPERFFNGAPENDPRELTTYPMDWAESWLDVSAAEIEYNLALGEALGYRLDPDRAGGARYNVVWNRRYGGDLQGVVEKLDFLEDLGVDAIYLCPVFEAGSEHKYDARDHRHIDRTLGDPGAPPTEWAPVEGEAQSPATWTFTSADQYFIDEFLPACKERGIRVILDGVFNHTGREHFAFRDVLENGASSEYAEWFNFEFDDEGNTIGWDAWDRPNGFLPTFRQTDRGDLVEPVKAHLYNVTRRWMDPNSDGDPSDGIDGWRLDVASEIGLLFWYDWRRLCRAINPDCVLIAEEWGDAERYFRGNAFDAQMNYPFARAVIGWLRDGVSSEETVRRLRDVFDHDPFTDLAQMNLLASHDTERLVTMLHNPGREYDQGAALHIGTAEGYDPGQPSERAYALAALGMAFQATHGGSPMIYNGDEFGVHGADDPDNRKPVPWPELGPQGDVADTPRTDVLEQAARWFGTRGIDRVGPILRYGTTDYIETGDPDVLGYIRALNGDRVYVLLNRGTSMFDASGALPEVDEEAGTTIEPLSARIWMTQRPRDFVWRPEAERNDPR
ncbi:MAG: glycoside hydrolase family 13 protein [Planctomycetota bacterium]